MTEKLKEILSLISAALPFFVLCLLGYKTNLNKKIRSKQFPMPLIAVIYVIVAALTADKINSGLQNLINAIPELLNYLKGLDWMPEAAANVLSLLSQQLESFISSLNLEFWVFFIANAVIMLGYIAFKGAVLGIISASVNNDSKLYNKAAELFYQYFPEKDVWCVKDSYSQARTFLKTFYYAAAVISSLLLPASGWMYLRDLLGELFYPVFGVIIVGELYFYLDGLTRREYTVDVLCEDENAYRVVNYSLLRRFLRNIFGDKLLAERTSVNNSFGNDVTNDEIIRKLETDEDPKIRAFAEYVANINANGFNIDRNYLFSTVSLMNGESILFNNPFYNDLIPYAFYPMNRTLLGHGKVLIIVGRHSVEDNIQDWISRGIGAVTNIPFMWKTAVLTQEPNQDIDIGIVTRSSILDIKMQSANAEFLENVEYVVIIEPTKILSTAQIGLNLLIKKCRGENDSKNLTFCICDKNCDGLVDAMSHALMVSITEVSATEHNHGTLSYMTWEADTELIHHRIVPNISRYLGVGTELSFAALKNQVSLTSWYGGEAFPVVDMNWIAKQYYYDLMKYSGLPTSQSAMDTFFKTSFDFWSAQVRKNNYLTVEDESNNMFEVFREFATRSSEQGFVNVIASEYLLKDYMADNASVFETDAKAIPYIAADYARTAVNTILRAILVMSFDFISEEALRKELSIISVKVFDLPRQLWYELYKCYADVDELASLPEDYTQAVMEASLRKLTFDGAIPNGLGMEIFKTRLHYNINRSRVETVYFIDHTEFISKCVAELKSAEYVIEDEKGGLHYLGAELNGQIYQRYLPGQFFTFAGKYYEMQYLTAEGNVLVRRASDHITSRVSYRQIRHYTITGVRPSVLTGSVRDISGMKVIKEHADIRVDTAGYFCMDRHNDFVNARKVVLEGRYSAIPTRKYHSKEILRIELPDGEGRLSDDIRYTITTLFNEVFRTLFAENQGYIVATTDTSHLPDDCCHPLTYLMSGEGYEVSRNSIYIIEDSRLDLGLTIAVERNLRRIFEIIQDYLDWHIEVLDESMQEPEPPPPVPVYDDKDGKGKPKKRGILGALSRLAEKIRNLFKRKGKSKKSGKEGEGANPENGESEKDRKKRQKAEKRRLRLEEKQRKREEKRRKKEEKKRRKNLPEPTPEPIPIPEPGPEPEPGGDGNDNLPDTSDEQTDWSPSGEDAADESGDEPGAADESRDGESAADSSPEESDGSIRKEDIGLTGYDNTAFDGLDGFTSMSQSPKNSPPPGRVDADDSGSAAGSAVGGDAGSAPQKSADTPDSDGSIFPKKGYYERYYLLYGEETPPKEINIDGTYDYLCALGLANNSLKQVRNGKNIARYIESTYVPNKANAHYCDFCGVEIMGAEFEMLQDGRERCINCARTAIKSVDELKAIFDDVKRNMESFFGISINVGIKVSMVNTKKLQKCYKKKFTPTPKADDRIVGVVLKDKHSKDYTLMLENGAPRMASMLTIAYELACVWQGINWNKKKIKRKYGRRLYKQIYVGMASWAEVQYAYLINEFATAKRREIILEHLDDDFGHGFIRYRANYPLTTGSYVSENNPFFDPENPLSEDYCGDIEAIKALKPKADADIERAESYIRRGRKRRSEDTTGGISRDPNNLHRYCYGILNSSEKAVYDRLYQGLISFETEITSLPAKIQSDRFKDIVFFVKCDHPEMIWFDEEARIAYSDDGVVKAVYPKYVLTQEEAIKRAEEIARAIDPFLSSMTDEMSDYEVALAAYENIIKLIKYDSLGLDEQKKHPDSTLPDDIRSIYGVFVDRKAVCAGYARAMQYLLNVLGIECAFIVSDTHAWNLVKLEGDYYHIDATWGCGKNTDPSKYVSDAVNYDFFCLTTEEIMRLEHHVPEERFKVPVCTATKCSYRVRGGLGAADKR